MSVVHPAVILSRTACILATDCTSQPHEGWVAGGSEQALGESAVLRVASWKHLRLLFPRVEDGMGWVRHKTLLERRGSSHLYLCSLARLSQEKAKEGPGTVRATQPRENLSVLVGARG